MKLKHIIAASCLALFALPAFGQELKSEKVVNIDFAAVCAGIKINNQDQATIAIAKCVGTITGYAFSHKMTSAYYQYRLKEDTGGNVEVRNYQSFCIPNDVDDFQLYSSVQAWNFKNQRTFYALAQRQNAESVRYAVIFSALTELYPCVNA